MLLLIRDNWCDLHDGDDGRSSMSRLVRHVGRFSQLERAMIRDRVMGTRILEEPQAKPSCKDAAETTQRVLEYDQAAV